MSADLRAHIARWFAQIAYEGHSAAQITQSINSVLPESRDAGFARECLFGSARHYEKLDWVAQRCLQKPLKAKEKQIKALLITALYQLLYMDTPEHAVLSETVNASRQLNRPWAAALLNGVLRTVTRNKNDLLNSPDQPLTVQHEMPDWLLKRLKNAWPAQWQTICENSNKKAPLTLRANEQYTIERAQKQLDEADIGYSQIQGIPSAFILEKARGVDQIPGFFDGVFSVQDASAQLAAQLLPIQSGDRVLDACAAPGGKTAHLLEKHPDIELTALELDPKRAEKITDNLKRLKINCSLELGDASQWQAPHTFNAILIDAPCSATGVIRRQPDIKLHRNDDDIYPTVQLQRAILDNLWQQLIPGGYLLYATCSILPDENHKQIKRFLKQTSDANVVSLDLPLPLQETTPFGVQIFPTPKNDGFFYALLQKRKRD